MMAETPTDLYELLGRVVENQRGMAAQVRSALDQCEVFTQLITKQQKLIDHLETAIRGQQKVLEALAGMQTAASDKEVH